MASSTPTTEARDHSPPRRHSNGPGIANRDVSGPGPQRPAASARFSVSQRLLDRELGIRAAHTFETQNFRQRFVGLRPRLVCDVYPPLNPGGNNEFLSMERSSILEIVVAPPLIIGLTEAGICSAFDMDTGRRVCVLNLSSREVIRSLFHNRSTNSLIIVVVVDSDQYTALHCRISTIDDLAAGSKNKTTDLFTTELLKSPGFVEFDDVNQKVLTFCARGRHYKMWSMAEPSKLLYAITYPNIEEIKISPGIMLVVFKKQQNFLPLKVLSIETGEVLKDFKQLINRAESIVVVEQFNQKLLLKQCYSPLNIIDLFSKEVVSVDCDRFQTPFAFIFLYDRLTFLAFRKTEVVLWDLNGELLTRFEDHTLWFPAAAEDHTSVIYITEKQDLIISLCETKRDPADTSQSQRSKVAIHISHIATGECLARADWHAHNRLTATAISYNDSRGDLVVGDEGGKIHVWSN